MNVSSLVPVQVKLMEVLVIFHLCGPCQYFHIHCKIWLLLLNLRSSAFLFEFAVVWSSIMSHKATVTDLRAAKKPKRHLLRVRRKCSIIIWIAKVKTSSLHNDGVLLVVYFCYHSNKTIRAPAEYTTVTTPLESRGFYHFSVSSRKLLIHLPVLTQEKLHFGRTRFMTEY